MPTLRDVRRRIRSVENTQKITRAMQMVAAAKFNRAQGDVAALRPYAEGTEALLQNFLRSGCVSEHPLLARETVTRRLFVVLASDRGLCAAYNSHVFRRAIKEIHKEENPENIAVVPLGRRATDFFRREPWKVLFEYRLIGDRLDVSRSREIAWHLERLYAKGEVDQVEVIYTRFITTLKREVVVRPLLGIRLEEKEEVPGVPYILEPSPSELLAHLLPRVLLTRVTAVLAEAFASEHSARMIAMRTATDNATELIDHLTLVRNRMRQAAITKELADIVGAAEAMK